MKNENQVHRPFWELDVTSLPHPPPLPPTPRIITGIQLNRAKMVSTHQGLSNALSLMCIRALDVHSFVMNRFGGSTTSQI